MAQMRDEYETPQTPIVISGNIGPRGDGYSPDRMMSANEAQDYHAEQIDVLPRTEADLVSAFTLNYVNEAIGVARAAKAAGMPVVISFTVETDGKLPTGQTLKDAIVETDCDDRQRAGLLHAQLRAPDAFRRCAGDRRAVDEAAARPARERLDAQPRRARCRARSRCGRSGRARAAVSRPARAHAAAHHSRRLLRHRSPPCGADLLCLHGGGERKVA